MAKSRVSRKRSSKHTAKNVSRKQRKNNVKNHTKKMIGGVKWPWQKRKSVQLPQLKPNPPMHSSKPNHTPIVYSLERLNLTSGKSGAGPDMSQEKYEEKVLKSEYKKYENIKTPENLRLEEKTQLDSNSQMVNNYKRVLEEIIRRNEFNNASFPRINEFDFNDIHTLKQKVYDVLNEKYGLNAPEIKNPTFDEINALDDKIQKKLNELSLYRF
jgi:hypothetical protein